MPPPGTPSRDPPRAPECRPVPLAQVWHAGKWVKRDLDGRDPIEGEEGAQRALYYGMEGNGGEDASRLRGRIRAGEDGA